MESLREIIKAEIERVGPISFERFMELALYHPIHGYYMKERIPWSRSGDYLTAPTLSGLFGALVSIQLKEFWEIMGRPKEFLVVEIGPGDGKLAKDILSFVSENEKGFFKALRYGLVEKNESFKIAQKKNLSIFQNISFYGDISELPEFDGVVLTNEVFDSIPTRVVDVDGKVREVYVGVKDGEFEEVLFDSGRDLVDYLQMLSAPLGRKFRAELSTKMGDLIHDISGKLTKGFMLTFDYGLTSKEYFMPERKRGTLLCYFRHRFHENPFINVGDQDITYHVNFSLFKLFAESCDLKTVGFCPLGSFLVSLGFDDLFTPSFKKLSPEELMNFKALITPYGFGENHRVMVNSKGFSDCKLRGFRLKNMLEAL